MGISVRDVLESLDKKVTSQTNAVGGQDIYSDGNMIDSSKFKLNSATGHYEADNYKDIYSAVGYNPTPVNSGNQGGGVPVRDILTKAGNNVTSVPNAGGNPYVFANGNPVDTSGFSINPATNRYEAPTVDAVMKSIGQTPLRSLQNEGHTIGYNEASKTPTMGGLPVDTSNLKNVEGKYYGTADVINSIGKNDQSIYKDTFAPQQADVQKQILDSINNPKQYNPVNDPALKIAQNQAQRQVEEEMNARGILNSTITSDRITQVTQELIPQYQALFEQKEQQRISNLNTYWQNINQMDSNQFQKFTDNRNYQYGLVKDDYIKQQDSITNKINQVSNAINKLNVLGYADNETAIIMGVPVGTESSAVIEAGKSKLYDLKLTLLKIQTDKDTVAEQHAFELTLDAARNAFISSQNTKTGTATSDKTSAAEDAKQTTEIYNENYANTVALFAKSNSWDALTNLTDRATYWIERIGSGNYTKLLNDIKTKYEAEKAKDPGWTGG